MADIFAGTAPQDVQAPTKFAPQFTFNLGSLQASGTPSLSTSVYQTKGELEVKESDALIADAGFNFGKLSVGQQIGGGKFEVGTPPKLTLGVTITVLSTNRQDQALVAVKATSPIAQVYIADELIQAVPGGLSIVSIGNQTRADDVNDVHTTQASARVTEDFDAGYFKLPVTPEVMKTRTTFISEPDPSNGVTAQVVFDASETVTP
ncbi:MAG TPA: hypothetical protein V6D47_10230 [Oscillatoriaceae cyanobacterium]